jgi:hypothetical protein
MAGTSPAMTGGTHSLRRALSERSGGVFVAAVLAAVGAFFAGHALRLDLGDIASPGPGFFPLLLGMILLGCGGLIGMECWRSPKGEALELGHRDVMITAAALLTVPLLFETLGAPVALGLFSMAILVFVGRVAPLVAIAATALGIVACWYFFVVLLGVQLPTGGWW